MQFATFKGFPCDFECFSLETKLASRWEGVRLPRASGKSPDFPGSSPNFPGTFSATSPEVLSLWNLTAILRFPGSCPKLPRKFPKLPGKFPDFPGGQPLSLGNLTPSPDSQKLSLMEIPFFPEDFRGSASIENPCSLGFSLPFYNKGHSKGHFKGCLRDLLDVHP